MLEDVFDVPDAPHVVSDAPPHPSLSVVRASRGFCDDDTSSIHCARTLSQLSEGGGEAMHHGSVHSPVW